MAVPAARTIIPVPAGSEEMAARAAAAAAERAQRAVMVVTAMARRAATAARRRWPEPEDQARPVEATSGAAGAGAVRTEALCRCFR
mgnify:CR=1 FL=1